MNPEQINILIQNLNTTIRELTAYSFGSYNYRMESEWSKIQTKIEQVADEILRLSLLVQAVSDPPIVQCQPLEDTTQDRK